MCTFRDDRTVQVCDLAIGHVRETVKETFGDLVRCTPMEGGGTLVEADSAVDTQMFAKRTAAAIAAAQTAAT